MPRKVMDDIDLERGERLKKIRESVGMNQGEFGRLTGGHPQGSVSNWEAKGQTIPNTALAALHRAGVNVLWLLTGDGDIENRG